MNVVACYRCLYVWYLVWFQGHKRNELLASAAPFPCLQREITCAFLAPNLHALLIEGVLLVRTQMAAAMAYEKEAGGVGGSAEDLKQLLQMKMVLRLMSQPTTRKLSASAAAARVLFCTVQVRSV